MAYRKNKRHIDRCLFPQKVKYTSKAKANKAAKLMKSRGKVKGTLEAYTCQEHWHIGTDRKRSQPEAILHRLFHPEE